MMRLCRESSRSYLGRPAPQAPRLLRGVSRAATPGRMGQESAEGKVVGRKRDGKRAKSAWPHSDEGPNMKGREAPLISPPPLNPRPGTQVEGEPTEHPNDITT